MLRSGTSGAVDEIIYHFGIPNEITVHYIFVVTGIVRIEAILRIPSANA